MRRPLASTQCLPIFVFLDLMWYDATAMSLWMSLSASCCKLVHFSFTAEITVKEAQFYKTAERRSSTFVLNEGKLLNHTALNSFFEMSFGSWFCTANLELPSR